jgi:hypothetical protein
VPEVMLAAAKSYLRRNGRRHPTPAERGRGPSPRSGHAYPARVACRREVEEVPRRFPLAGRTRRLLHRQINTVAAWHVQLDKLARKLGCMAAFERLED